MTDLVHSRVEENPTQANAVGYYSWNVREDRVFGDSIFADIFGIAFEELQHGAPVTQVLQYVEDGDKQRLAKAMHETIVSGDACQQAYSIHHPDGRVLFVQGRGRCLRDPAGMPSIYTGTVTVHDEHAGNQADEIPDPLAQHTLEALRIARERDDLLAVRYLSSALNIIGGKG